MVTYGCGGGKLTILWRVIISCYMSRGKVLVTKKKLSIFSFSFYLYMYVYIRGNNAHKHGILFSL